MTPGTSANGDESRSPRTTIITATLARPERGDSLLRAIESVHEGNRIPLQVLVVINGQQHDRRLVQELSDSGRVLTLRLEEASFAKALALGVEHCATPFLGFLDDDDEYLPGAVDLRVKALAARPGAALLATNGFRRVEGVDVSALKNLEAVERAPLVALFRQNWLPSCGGLFRRSLLPDDLFHGLPPLLEWTWIAFRVAQETGAVAVLDEPTFRIHSSPASQSKSPEYLLSLPRTLERILDRVERRDIRSAVRAHLAQALYQSSVYHMKEGQYLDAWRYHLRCLGYPEGRKYWKHTARLLGVPKRTRNNHEPAG